MTFISASSSTSYGFSIWKSDTERSHKGVLMVKINGGPLKNVCRKVNNYNTYYPTAASAQFICESLGYHNLVSTEITGSMYPFRTHYTSGLYNLACSSASVCTATSSTACLGTTFYAHMSCNCTGSSFATPTDGCVSCPANSAPLPGLEDRCSCQPGFFWSGRHCVLCPAYTFSEGNATKCAKCPNGAHSEVGSRSCSCFAGLRKVGDRCEECADDRFSSHNSTHCTDCPVGATSTPDHVKCVCPGGTLWNPVSNVCNPFAHNGTGRVSNETKPRLEEESSRESPSMVLVVALLVVLVVICAATCIMSLPDLWKKHNGAGVMFSVRGESQPPNMHPPPPPEMCCAEEGIYVDKDGDSAF